MAAINRALGKVRAWGWNECRKPLLHSPGPGVMVGRFVQAVEATKRGLLLFREELASMQKPRRLWIASAAHATSQRPSEDCRHTPSDERTTEFPTRESNMPEAACQSLWLVALYCQRAREVPQSGWKVGRG